MKQWNPKMADEFQEALKIAQSLSRFVVGFVIEDTGYNIGGGSFDPLAPACRDLLKIKIRGYTFYYEKGSE